MGGPLADRDPEGIDVIKAAYELQLDAEAPGRTARAINRFLELLAPSVVFRVEDGPSREGHEAVKGLLQRALGEWASVSYQLDEIRDFGDGRFLATGKVLAWTRDRSCPAQIPFINLWILRRGQVVGIESFSDRQQAAAAFAR
jgi:hypothetical protein